jgi:tetraacyldisaccharide 4'-kinase
VNHRDFLDIISGRRNGPSASLTRAVLAAAEVPYSAAIAIRNRLYDRGILPISKLPQPTVSVGNLTTGGVGKTPLVAWLATALRGIGHKPAVLMRGYKSVGESSDEQVLLSEAVPGEALPVIADPDRRRGAETALAKHPEIDVFLLDDAMQHRRVARDVEIVVISAVEPFGLGHILPRGLLRESLAGLKRAHAVVITHANEVMPEKLSDIETAIRRFNGSAPIFHADHRHLSLRSRDETMSMEVLSQTPYFLACGIGQPESLLAQLQKAWPKCAGHHFFEDHHRFTRGEVEELVQQAASAGAGAIVVTEKDWVKLEPLALAAAHAVPIWRLRLEISFWSNDGQRLLELLSERLVRHS